MRVVPVCIAVLFTVVLAAGCADAPTAPGVVASVETAGPVRDVTLDPVVVVAPKPGCDPYLTLGGCGGDTCMTSVPGDDPGFVGIMGCPGDGGGEPGGGDPGGGGTPGSGEEPALTPYDEGPLLWAACVLAFIGGAYSMEVVGNKFGAWHDAHKALVTARRALDITLEMQRNGTLVDPSEVQLKYYQLEQAILRRDDAIGAVEEATGVSILTLLGAGFACGAAAIAPTP